jgi:BirA family biotin operon repressor/biotin-[acetyl-CoA-carboxylase] ligase
VTRPDAAARRLAILAALRAAPGGVSGETIASRIGVSRVAVRKHVEALRAAGYEIGARAGSGYVLLAAPDAPLPAEVGPLLRSEMWVRLEGGGSTGSTNDDARALAVAGAPEGTVVLASQQTGGRGRMGRGWRSPVGGVYLSAVLRPEGGPAQLGALPLAVGLGVALGLEALGARPALKWPNDVVVRDGEGVGARSGPGVATGWRKLAGVLLESSVEGENVSWVVAGVGVNVRGAGGVSREGADCGAPAAYLDQIAAGAMLPEVAAAVLDGIAGAYARYISGGFETLREQYAGRDVLAGRDVVVRDRCGVPLVAGRCAGVDGSGRLIVRTSDGETAVASGEVTLRDG